MQAVDREKDTIICDLDGTIALDDQRAHFLHPKHKPHCMAVEISVNEECPSCGSGPRDWNSYFAACAGDTPNEAVIEVIRALWDFGYNIRILTARSESTRLLTELWLARHAVPHHTLLMRPIDDRTDDYLWKPTIAGEHGWRQENVLFVMEDRQRVVNAWRSLGYTVFQVAPGNF